jgi:hypothetical protein
MPRWKIEFEHNWEPRKRDMGNAQIRKWLANMGGVSGIDKVQMILMDPLENEATPKRKLLRLTCNFFPKKTLARCGHVWESETFSDCPVGGKAHRTGVVKLAVEEYASHPLSEGPLPQKAEPATPKSAPPPPVTVIEPEHRVEPTPETAPGTPEDALPPAVVSQRRQEFEDSGSLPNY